MRAYGLDLLTCFSEQNMLHVMGCHLQDEAIKSAFILGSLSLLLSLGKDGCHIVKQPWGEVHVVKNGGLQETPSMHLEADLLRPDKNHLSESGSRFPATVKPCR